MNAPVTERQYVVIQRNPKAGSRTRRSELLELIRELKLRGYQPRLFRHRDRLATWMAVPEHRQRLRCLVAAGGDGTVGDLVTRYPQVPLAVLPLGTENLLAKYFRLSRSGRELARIVHAGRELELDVGQLGSRRFLICAGVGIDAAVIHDVHEARRGHISKAHYLLPILRSICRRNWPELTIRDDRNQEYRATHVLMFNLPVYARGMRWVHAAAGDDGRLEVRLFDRPSVGKLLSLVWSAWWGTIESRRDVVCLSTSTITITSITPVPVHVDGDPAGMTPVEITVIPRALRLIVP